MKTNGWRTRLLASTRGKILELLRGKEQTVNELAAALNLTDNAVRAHLSTLERDGLARQVGTQPGFRKPHATYGVTAEAEQIFPKAYGPLLDLFLTVLSNKLEPTALRASMREVGKRVAANYPAEVRSKTRERRIEAALRILKELGGSATSETSEGKQWIRGNGCPLAAATAQHPQACLIVESLLAEIIGVPVKQHCTYKPMPSCCFEVQ